MTRDDQAGEVHARTHDHHTAVITIDRPAVRNALGWRTWSDLDDCLAWASEDTDIQAIVLTGADGFFSAGGDIATMGENGSGVLAPGARLRRAHDLLRDLYSCPKPTIAAIEGYAIGVGWSLALTCDFLVCGRGAYFWAPFSRIGLVPDGGLAWLLSRQLGHGSAALALYLGDKIQMSDERARALVTDVVDDGRALERATGLAAQLAEVPQTVLALTKRLLRQSQEAGHSEFLRVEDLAATLNMHGADVAARRRALEGDVSSTSSKTR